MRAVFPDDGFPLPRPGPAGLRALVHGRLPPRLETGPCNVEVDSAELPTCWNRSAHRAPPIKEHLMRIAKRLGMVLVAVCAFSVMAVSSASAAPLFLSHPTGLLLASAGGTQTFTTTAGPVTCTALKLLHPGDLTVALRSLTLLAIVDYENCKAFGILPITVHPVRYLFDANGLTTVESTILLLGEQGCVITVPAAKNQSLWTVKYENTVANKGILLLAKVKGITSSGVGGPGNLCEYTEEHEGEYVGNVHIVLDPQPSNPNAVIRWDP
jgi:hypothetical protein